MSRRPSTYKYATAGIFCIGTLSFLYFFVPVAFPSEYYLASGIKQLKISKNESSPQTRQEPVFVVTHLKTPVPLKAIYMTQCVAGLKSFRNDLAKIAETTEINSIVIDIKDYSGRISFPTENPMLKPAVAENCRATDMKEFIGSLHDKNIYVIGRITVFQDPFMTAAHPERAVHKLSDGGVWKDFKGLSFIDVGSKEHWDYIVELSKESYAVGFDELNFDYIRYPSDGNMKDTAFMLPTGKTKPQMLKEFFAYLESKIRPTGAVLSADLFGMTTTNSDDLNIGQILEHALEHFDYVAPMVYPSHYPPTFNGYGDPNKYPYEVVKYSMDKAVEKAQAFDLSRSQMATAAAVNNQNLNPITTADASLGNSAKKLRPWLQDFDYGGNYDIAEVRAQIKATYDAGLDSWMLWSPSNRYTLGALEREI